MEHDWPLVRVLKAGDEAVGVPVLTELYDRMKASPVAPDLTAMWRDLGVRPSDISVVFDQTAPHSWIVRSIMASRPGLSGRCEK
jgi:phenylpyruvate tautomerase PptA (4-oxalocrotonate tautomerase family)